MDEILEYQYAWNLTDKTGLLRVKSKKKKWSKWREFTNESEFQIIISTLRHEKPVFIGTQEGKLTIKTTKEPTGEEEF